MDLAHDKSLRSPDQNDGEEQQSTSAQTVQGSAIPFTTIFEHMPDAFLALDMQGRITYLNHQAESFLQKTRAQLLGSSIWKPFRIYETPLSSRIASKRKPQAKPCLLNIVLLPSTNGFTSISILQKKVFVSISRILQNEKKQKNDCTRVKSASVP